MRTNYAVMMKAIFFAAVALGLSLVWVIALLVIHDHLKSCEDGLCGDHWIPTGIEIAVVVSSFWTHHVIQNTLKVTVAGVVGKIQSCCYLKRRTLAKSVCCFSKVTWWFEPDSSVSHNMISSTVR